MKLSQELQEAIRELVALYVKDIFKAEQRRIQSLLTKTGLQRAKAQGRLGGRPRIMHDHEKIMKMRKAGMSLGKIAVELKMSKTTVHRIVRDAGK
jgi:DNA invertase Pin-like site-specific DNA recombinase